MTTLRDVANVAGVSVSTASRVLSGDGFASKDARQAVLKAAEQLDYVVNTVARNLRQESTFLLGLIISNIENPFYASLARAMEAVARHAGYNVVIMNSDDDPMKEKTLIGLMRELCVDGMVISPTHGNLEALVRVRDAGIPLVQIDRVIPPLNASSILLDNEEAAIQAVELLAASGHRHVAAVSGPRISTTGEERARGLKRAAQVVHGIETVQVYEASFRRSDAKETVREALNSVAKVVIAGNNIIAEACMEIIKEERLRCPDDVSLVAFDDVPWMQWVTPSLTAIRQPVSGMARRATEILLDEIASDGEANPIQERYAAKLVSRSSVARLIL